MKTIVVGLGNPILGDDGVGWKVVEAVKNQLTVSADTLLDGEGCKIDTECLSLGGISLMEHLIGYHRAILIDSFMSNAEEVGAISIRRLNDLPNYSAFHITSAHDTSLQHAFELGRSLGAQLPEDVTVVGIATQRIYDFSEELSPSVAEAVPQAAHVVLNLLLQNVTL